MFCRGRSGESRAFFIPLRLPFLYFIVSKAFSPLLLVRFPSGKRLIILIYMYTCQSYSSNVP